MSKSLKTAAEKGIPILAECGGMMALTESINNQAAFGLLPGKVEMQNKLQGIGTQFLLLPATQGCAEATIYGHTFHYSKFETRMIPIASAVTQRQSAGEWIYKQDNILASYMHFYFPSNPVVTASFFTKNDDQVVL